MSETFSEIIKSDNYTEKFGKYDMNWKDTKPSDDIDPMSSVS